MPPTIVLAVGGAALFTAILLAVLSLTGSRPKANTGEQAGPEKHRFAPGTTPVENESLAERAITPSVQRLARIGRALTPQGSKAWLQRHLDLAGNPADRSPARVAELQGLGLLLGLTAGGAIGFVLGLGLLKLLLCAAAGALIGFWLPFILVREAGVKRQQRIQRDMPDALDLLTLSVEAGLGFDAAAAQVANSMPGPLAGEFVRMQQEMQMGLRRAEALRAMGARTSVPELRVLVTALVQAADLGIPIATVLREQAKQMRLVRRQRAEERAQKLPVKVMIPLVLCLFPALFVVVIGPAIVNLIRDFPH